jgi:hypothetical protein
MKRTRESDLSRPGTPRFRDEEINYSDAPPITDWSKAVKGPYLESIRILRERRKAESQKAS